MVLPVLKNQIEYYFSIENLCKDMYLRARMDSQGFVPLHFIAAFKRVRELSADSGMVRAVCEGSVEVDLVVGEDDIERVRRRDGWEKFVLPLEDRDEFARNHGPVHLTYKNRSYQMGPQFNGVSPGAYGVASPPAYPQHVDAAFQQMADDTAINHGMNGYAYANGHGMATQLSANVPDFSPAGPGSFEQLKSAAGETGKSLAVQASQKLNGHVENIPLSNGVHAEASFQS